MTVSSADAFVLFGATVDLALEKIFPALQTMARCGNLDIPVIGMGLRGLDAGQPGTERRRR